MRPILKSLRVLPVFLTAVGALAGKAGAEILITFKQVNNDVVATTSGSITVPSSLFSFSADVLVGKNARLSYLTGQVVANFNGAPISGEMPISVGPTVGFGDDFGIEGGSIYFDGTAQPDSVYTPQTVWTWNNTTIADIGLGNLTNTPVTVYVASNDETVSIVADVPGGYDGWASVRGIDKEQPEDDHDRDGLANLMEYALGSSPTKSNGQPAVIESDVVTFNKGAQAAANGDVTYRIMMSTTLAADSWSYVDPLEESEILISYQLPYGLQSVFVRLEVTKN